jgi:hypothetical protein
MTAAIVVRLFICYFCRGGHHCYHHFVLSHCHLFFLFPIPYPEFLRMPCLVQLSAVASGLYL